MDNYLDVQRVYVCINIFMRHRRIRPPVRASSEALRALEEAFRTPAEALRASDEALRAHKYLLTS